MKKQVIILLTAVLASTMLFDSCKKGENDPFLSLRSRKARLVGEWKLTAGEETYTSSNSVSSTTTSRTYDGSNRTSTTNGSSSTTAYVESWTFEKDGTYKMSANGGSGAGVWTIEESGTWNFMGGVGEEKKKSQIILYTLSYKETSGTSANNVINEYTATGASATSTIMKIDELRNKKIVFIYDNSYTPSSGTSTSLKGTKTFEQ
ncbi:MAG: hypothetical protein J0M08_01270 [Bacteroidetes bacterium]|nr:hypothetical protein [Bacteroidota bacterium]